MWDLFYGCRFTAAEWRKYIPFGYQAIEDKNRLQKVDQPTFAVVPTWPMFVMLMDTGMALINGGKLTEQLLRKWLGT